MKLISEKKLYQLDSFPASDQLERNLSTIQNCPEKSKNIYLIKLV